MGDDVVLDTPGIYGVSSFNDEETVARDIILAADVVVNVVDAVHLERDLFLTLQLIDMGMPMVVALNMIDEAASARAWHVDADLLERPARRAGDPDRGAAGQGLRRACSRALDSAAPGLSDPDAAGAPQRAARPRRVTRPRRCSCSRATPSWPTRHGLAPERPARRDLPGAAAAA